MKCLADEYAVASVCIKTCMTLIYILDKEMFLLSLTLLHGQTIAMVQEFKKHAAGADFDQGIG
jgi:hypothetical protein